MNHEVLWFESRGLVTQIKDARNVIANMTYDAAGRMLTRAFPAATTENVTFAYDSIASGNKGKGQLTQLNDPAGNSRAALRYGYGRSSFKKPNRWLFVCYANRSSPYDAAGNVTQDLKNSIDAYNSRITLNPFAVLAVENQHHNQQHKYK